MEKIIMIIDDSLILRQVVKAILKEAGYEVVEADNGKEALEKLKTENVDLIICSLDIPNMDCIFFIKYLKKLPKYSFTPIIMLTTESDKHKIQEGKAAGATAWVVKPFDSETILGAIERLLLR